MIIWGRKGKSKTVGDATFHCPNCRGQRRFNHERVGKYLFLYFIPLLENEKIGVFSWDS